MSRLPRLQAPAIYHVTTRGTGPCDIFRDDADRQTFLDIVAVVVDRYGWDCLGYCVMSTHFHLHIRTHDENLARGMQQLNSSYARSFNRRYGRVGHLVQERYAAILVQTDGHFRELIRYIANNPVDAGIVAEPHEWPWSSYSVLMGTATAPTFFNDEILELFGAGREGQLAALRVFVNERRAAVA